MTTRSNAVVSAAILATAVLATPQVAEAAPRSKPDQAFINANIDAVRRLHAVYGIPVSVYFGVVASEIGLYDHVDPKGLHSWWAIPRTNNYYSLANGTLPAEGKKKGMVCNSKICLQTFSSFEDAARQFSETVCGYIDDKKKAPLKYPAAIAYARKYHTAPASFDAATWIDLLGPSYCCSTWAGSVKASIRNMDLELEDLDDLPVCPPSAVP